MKIIFLLQAYLTSEIGEFGDSSSLAFLDEAEESMIIGLSCFRHLHIKTCLSSRFLLLEFHENIDFICN